MGNRVEYAVNDLIKKSQMNVLEGTLDNLGLLKLNDAEKRTWHYYYGIAAYTRGDREASYRRFKEAARLFPNDEGILFSMGQEHEHRGEKEAMIRCFDRALFPSIPAAQALTAARYAYLWTLPEKGLTYIEPLFQAYVKLRNIDETFLSLRQYPLFSQVWGYYTAFCWQLTDLSRPAGRLKEFEKRLQGYDFKPDHLEIACMIKGDFTELIMEQDEIMKENRKRYIPCGRIALRHAALKSLTEPYQEGTKLLDEVCLTMKDRPWLEDIRLAAKASLAHRHGKTDVEQGLRELFFQNQPLLFEPHHALHYQLLQYQESLAGIYTSGRKGPA
jgi:hypothetical protein